MMGVYILFIPQRGSKLRCCLLNPVKELTNLGTSWMMPVNIT